jgi:hypothetical protein
LDWIKSEIEESGSKKGRTKEGGIKEGKIKEGNCMHVEYMYDFMHK